MSICKECFHYEVCKHNAMYDKDSIVGCNQFKPKADYVEVVRCTECKYGRFNYCGDFFCSFHHSFMEMKRTDFCSHGKRKESEVQGE